MTKKTVTIEELAQITIRGFDGLTSEMNSRFDAVDEKLASIENRVSKIEAVLFRNHEERLLRLEDALFKK